MLVKLENPAVVQPQSSPHCIPALHGGIKRTDPRLIAMHELTVNINDQIAISIIEFLKHGLIRIALITQDSLVVASFVSNAQRITSAIARKSRSGLLSAIDIRKAFHKHRNSAHKFPVNARVLWRYSDDMAETMSSLLLHRTNGWPRYHRSHEIQAARKASIRETRRRLPRKVGATSVQDFQVHLLYPRPAEPNSCECARNQRSLLAAQTPGPAELR